MNFLNFKDVPQETQSIELLDALCRGVFLDPRRYMHTVLVSKEFPGLFFAVEATYSHGFVIHAYWTPELTTSSKSHPG